MARKGVNKVILLGNLGSDPDMKQTNQGSAVCNLSVATSESWKDKNTGQQQEKTEWHRVVMFGKLGEIAAQYLRKGSKIYLEGKLQTRKWQDQQGQDRYSTEIVADEMQMLDSKPAGQPAQQQGGWPQQQQQPQGQWQQQSQPQAQGQYQQRPPYQNGAPQPQTQQRPQYQQAQMPGQQQGGFDEFSDDIPF